MSRGAGVVVDSARRDDVVSEVARLLDDDVVRRAMGRAGRRYAEETFDPEAAADRFVEVFGDLTASDTQPVIGTRTGRDLDMSCSGGRLRDHDPSSAMGDATPDDKVTTSGPFSHHVG